MGVIVEMYCGCQHKYPDADSVDSGLSGGVVVGVSQKTEEWKETPSIMRVVAVYPSSSVMLAYVEGSWDEINKCEHSFHDLGGPGPGPDEADELN